MNPSKQTPPWEPHVVSSRDSSALQHGNTPAEPGGSQFARAKAIKKLEFRKSLAGN